MSKVQTIMPRGIVAKEFNLPQKVRADDSEMTTRAWTRVLHGQVQIEGNLIGYATYMGPGAATSVQSHLGWNDTFCKFQPIKIYVVEDWDALKRREDFKLTSFDQPVPDPKMLARKEEVSKKELYDLKAIAKELGVVKPDQKGEVRGYTRNQLIDMIVKHELEADR